MSKLKSINIGKLNRRIEIYDQTTVSDGAGGLSTTAETLAATVWGGISSQNAKRVDHLGREHTINEYYFTFRTESVSTYLTDIGTYHLKIDNVDYKIIEIIDEDLDTKITTVKAVKA